MRFSDAVLESVSSGAAMKREAWSDGFVYYNPEAERARPDGPMKTNLVHVSHAGVETPNWIASDEDLDARDWVVVEANA